MILKHRGASYQRARIVGSCFQQLAENGGFSRCGGRPLVRRSRLGLLRILQTARHTDAVVLLAGHRHPDHLRQEAGGERLRVDNLARPHFQLRGAEQDVAPRRERLRSLGRAIEKAGRSGLGLHRVTGEQDVPGFGRQRCLHPGAHQLGPARQQNQTYGLLFLGRLCENNAG